MPHLPKPRPIRLHHHQLLPPQDNTPNARKDVPAMIATIGVVVPSANALTPVEASAPTPNCNAPSSDEAVPAFLAKGAIASAARSDS